MKFPFLLFTTVTLAAPVQRVQVRVVSIEKSGVATSLAAAVPDSDESLYAALIADTAAGRAKTVHDQVIVVRSGQRSKVDSVREFPYQIAADAEPSEWFQYPSSFTWQYLGQTMEVEVTVGEDAPLGLPGRLIDLNLAPESCMLLAMHPWPVPDFRGPGKMGRVLRPVFGIHKLSAQALAWTGRSLLLSVAASPRTVLTDAVEPSYRYTFLRAGIDGEKPASAGVKPTSLQVKERRLHAVIIRLPRDEAAALMFRHSGDDAALYAQLCRQIVGGTATLNGHIAVLCRGGQRSKVESFADFSVPRDYADLIPWQWSSVLPGSELEVEAEGDSGEWNLSLSLREAPELVLYHPDAKHPALHGAAAEYVERKFPGPLRIPPSGVLCSGLLSTTPATEQEDAPNGLTDVCFLLQWPPPEKPRDDPRPHILVHGLILSVSAEEGPGLVAAVKSRAASGPVGALLARLTAGEITCAAHLALVMRSGSQSHTSCVRWVEQPGEFHPSNAVPELTLGSSWSSTACGLKLEADYQQGEKGIALNGSMEWDTAPVSGFGEPGAAIPNMAVRRCTQRIELHDIHLTNNQPVIADVRASNAREGTPEHGRWHVMILLAR